MNTPKLTAILSGALRQVADHPADIVSSETRLITTGKLEMTAKGPAGDRYRITVEHLT